VVVAVDTSGSISAALGAAFVAELQRLRPHCLALTVLMADDTVHAVLTGEALPGRSFRGRGNTDFNAALAYVNTHLRDHDLCVYLTDGQGKLPEVQSVVPLVWVVTENRQFPGRPVVFVPTK
jgi:predicted metal-dependent peptidase